MFIFFWSNVLYDILMSSSLPSSARRTSFLCSRVNKATLSHLFVLDELYTCTDFHFMRSLSSSSCDWWASHLPNAHALVLKQLITCQPFLRAPNLPALALLELPTYLHLILKSFSPASIVFDELLTCHPLYLMSFSPVVPCIWWASHQPAIVFYELLTCHPLYFMSFSPASHCILWAHHLPGFVFDDELLICHPLYLMSFPPASHCIWWAPHLPALVFDELLTCHPL